MMQISNSVYTPVGTIYNPLIVHTSDMSYSKKSERAHKSSRKGKGYHYIDSVNERYASQRLDVRWVINLERIQKMAYFEENWDGNDAMPFSSQAILLFESVISGLQKQPDIYPTAAESIVMKYELEQDELYMQVNLSGVDIVIIRNGDYLNAEEKTIQRDADMILNLNREVNQFYGSEMH